MVVTSLLDVDDESGEEQRDGDEGHDESEEETWRTEG